MLLLRQFPDPKRLEPTARNEAFRRAFYARWGRENAIVLARSRRIEYPLYGQRLSIKMAAGGRERYRLTHPVREVDVDDDHFLVLNDGRVYGSAIRERREIESFSIFFRAGFADEVRQGMRTPAGRALDGVLTPEAGGTEFLEYLRPQDRHVTPALRHIRRHVLLGVDDVDWYEEQLYGLLERMIEQDALERRRAAELPALRSATRAEIHRRILRAADYINTCYEGDVSLDRLAAEACLSKYHFLRLFRQVMGITPHACVLRRRTQVAARLIATTRLGLEEIAQQTGFATRSGLFRQMRRWMGRSPCELRPPESNR
jgi:AraC-like DNA-binding protein